MNKPVLLTLLFIIGLGLMLHALPVKISGTFHGAASKQVYLIYCSDRIIFHEEILASTVVDSSSHFTIETDIREIQLVRIQVGHYSADLYLSPGCDLVLQSDTLHFNNHYKSFLEYEYLELAISGNDPGSLNLKIRQLNEVVNVFILDNFSGALRRLNKDLLDTLRKEIQKIELPGNEFFDVYREYKLAVIEMSVYGTGKKELFRKFFFKRQVYYYNPEYMDFFNQYFKNYLLAADQVVPYTDILYTVNYLGSYKALNDSTGKDTLLKNEVLREIVLLKQLKEWYYNPDFIQTKVLDIIAQVVASSKFPEHIATAKNIIHDLTLFSRGSPVPWFNLEDMKGGKFNSDDLEKKCTYICFVNIESPSSRYELERLFEFSGEFKEQVRFVIISLDPDKQLFINYTNEHPSEFLSLYNGIDFPLVFKYKLSTLPVFMLLNDKLEIVSFPAAKPGEKVEDQIRFLIKN